MGAVYEVQDPVTHQRFAMKLGATSGEEDSRFGAIHSALSKLAHEGVVTSHKVETTADGRIFQLLGFIDGQPAQVFAKSLGPPGCEPRTTAVITVAIHIAEALAYLHCHEIIHRDIKSANVLVREDRSACLIDFGSALMPGIVATQGRFVGTYTYAPPEQLNGHKVDHRADLYAFGVLLYRMLSGVRPFDGASPQALIAQHLNDSPSPLNQRVSNAPPEVVALVSRLLEKNPADRPQSAAEVTRILRASTATTG